MQQDTPKGLNVAIPATDGSSLRAVAFVKSFFEAGKPVAAICHGPWTVIESGAAKQQITRLTDGALSPEGDSGDRG